MGRIPVFIYDDIPWIAYRGTPIGIDNFGLVGVFSPTYNNLSAVFEQIANMSAVEFNRRLSVVRDVREWYTNDGVFKQFELFLLDPFGPSGGHLKCGVHARTERCCDYRV